MPAGTSLTQQRDQRVALIQSGTEGDFYFGIMVDPKIFLPRRILDPDDNQMCYEIEEKTRVPTWPSTCPYRNARR
jgi:hypothetical protein